MASDLYVQRSRTRLIPPVLAAAAATGVSAVLPLASPLLVALVVGVVITNCRYGKHGVLEGQAELTKRLLRWGVVLLGLKLPIDAVLEIGPAGIIVIVSTVFVTYFGTLEVGRRLGLEPRFVTLVAAGFSICGAAAIAAVTDTVRARQRDVGIAVALVTVFGSVMIAIVPWVANVLDLSDQQAAVWAGASIHEVAQVVAAGSLLGGGAVAVAMTVKLGRVALLAPMSILAARRFSVGTGRGRPPYLPWFLVGFMVAVVVRSSGVLPGSAVSASSVATNLLLAAGMFGLGLGIRFADLWPISGRALALAVFSTFIAAGTSLLGVAITV